MIAVAGLSITTAAILMASRPVTTVERVNVPDPYIPPVCVRALQGAEKNTLAAADLVAVLNRSAPLLARAYKDGLNGVDASRWEDRIHTLNGAVDDAYAKAMRVRSGYELAVAQCENEATR